MIYNNNDNNDNNTSHLSNIDMTSVQYDTCPI